MPTPDNRVAVIGGGISGLTTAILLQVNGYRTFLYAKKGPSREPDIVREPEFASLHAAASILPHSVSSPKISYWTATSHEYFSALSFSAAYGVRTQLHYEVFEGPTRPRPAYSEAVRNFQLLDSVSLGSHWVPRRPGAKHITGWKFDVFFCEAPEYMRHLYGLYQEIGGRVIPAEELPDGSLLSYLNLNYKYYINCTGCNSHNFIDKSFKGDQSGARFVDWPDNPNADLPGFEPLVDPFPPKLIRGHYLRVDIKEIVTGNAGRFISYNYEPEPEIYRTAKGLPADVYCYPRSDAWILGGSRQEGRMTKAGTWEWEPTVGTETTFERNEDGGKLTVPSPIFDLNAELLLEMTEGRVDLRRLYNDEPSIVAPGLGYRYVRDSPSESVRLSVSRLQDKLGRRGEADLKYVFHNYGHGGSGFTLSWGCSFDVLKLLDRVTGREPVNRVRLHRRKFVLGHAATVMMLSDLTARLMAKEVL